MNNPAPNPINERKWTVKFANNNQGDISMSELTFGQKAVGLTFNPSGSVPVQQIKERSAALIDTLNDYRNATDDGEMKRMLSVAITEVQTAQMWGVKGVTWKL